MSTVAEPVEQDEDGVWCAYALVGRVGCNGYGDTRDEAVADLRQAVLMVLATGVGYLVKVYSTKFPKQ